MMKMFSIMALTLMACTAGATAADHDGRYIYIRKAYFQMNPKEKKEVTEYAATLLVNEVKENLGHVPSLKTLSNSLLAPNMMDTLTAQTNRAVQLTSVSGWQHLMPAGFMIYGGGSVGISAGLSGKASGNLGMVVIPEEVIVIDTLTGKKEERFSLDLATVVVPHLYAGLGVGGGASASVGAAIIFGQIDQAKDFAGAVLAGSAQAIAAIGIELQPTVVHNFATGKTLFAFGVEASAGPEAMASVDGEIGYILPLGKWLSLHGASTEPAKVLPSKVSFIQPL